MICTHGIVDVSFSYDENANHKGSYVVERVLMGYKSLISNEEQVFKKFTYF